MKPSFCKALAASHVAAVTIAVLLLWSLDAAFRALWPPLSRVIDFVLTGIAILDIPYLSPGLTVTDRSMLMIASGYLYEAVISFFGAWLLSRWAYGVGPFSTLAGCGREVIRRSNV